MQSEIILFRTAPRRDDAAADTDRQIKPRPRLTDPIFPASVAGPAQQDASKPQR